MIKSKADGEIRLIGFHKSMVDNAISAIRPWKKSARSFELISDCDSADK